MLNRESNNPPPEQRDIDRRFTQSGVEPITHSEMAMIEAIEFRNFKALRKTTLPLGPFTLLLGPNGAGKTTVLQALQFIAAIAAQQITPGQRTATEKLLELDDETGFQQIVNPAQAQSRQVWSSLLSVTSEDRQSTVEVGLLLSFSRQFLATFQWYPNNRIACSSATPTTWRSRSPTKCCALQWLSRMQTYALDFSAIAHPVQVNSGASLQANGAGLAAVLDDLKDNQPERWESLLAEMRQWLPEYDNIHFDKPQPGQKAIVLRTSRGGHRIPAKDLSQGTLLALTLLTLAYLPNRAFAGRTGGDRP